MLVEILIVLALIALNGVLSMSELAIISARPARLRPLEGKSRGAAAALGPKVRNPAARVTPRDAVERLWVELARTSLTL